MSGGSAVPGRRRRRVARAALLVIALPVLGEVVCRVALGGAPESLREVVASMRLPLEDANELAETPHPYFAWSRDEWRERFPAEAAYFAGEEARTTFDVLVVGGALASRFVREDGGALADALARATTGAESAARAVRVLDLTGDRLKQPQPLHLVAYALQLGWLPDAVVLVDGGEDVALGLDNADHGVHPLRPWFHLWSAVDRSAGSGLLPAGLLIEARGLQRDAARLLGGAERFGLQRSALADALWLRGRLERARTSFQSACARYEDFVDGRPRLAVVGSAFSPASTRPLIGDIWFESSLSLDAVCRARSIRYLHVFAPATPAEERAVDLVDELRAKGTELRAHGVALVELPASDAPELVEIVGRIAAELGRESG